VNQSENVGVYVDEIIGDGAYSEKDNIKFTNNHNIKLIAKLSKTVPQENKKMKNKFFN